MRNKKLILANISITFIVLGLLSIEILRPSVPKTILKIKQGDSIEYIRNLDPEIELFGNSMKFYIIRLKTKRLGIDFTWNVSLYCDENDRIYLLEGRSNNKFLGGLIDKKFSFFQ
jgi:hypothetical protein